MDETHSEIAKQFVLPERQSKIHSLLSSEQNRTAQGALLPGQEVFCVCKSSEEKGFMIACDRCETWFHGKCVGVKAKDESRIISFYCQRRPKRREKTVNKRRKSHTTPDSPRSDGGYTPPPPRRRGDETDSDENNSDSEEAQKKKPGKRKEEKVVKKPTRRAFKKPEAVDEQQQPLEPYGEDRRRQCLGPSCQHAARFRSKYCSEECGLRLASQRIFMILPERVKEWRQGSAAEVKDKEKLVEVREKLQKNQTRMELLDKKLREHIDLVQRVKKLSPETDSDDESEAQEAEGSMYCITCGMEISSKIATKHLEKCFIRVCGSPIVNDLFIPTEKYCRKLKRKCTDHFLWDRLRRAEIDGMRVKEFLLRDELFEEERQLRQAMKNRGGLMALMLHSTCDIRKLEKQMKRQTYQMQAHVEHSSGEIAARTPSPKPSMPV
ncbi:unnamed protein product [Notodromas monacha]|uniref:CXXC-type zinc finger protein 1 n=1 Tax=Notodromas monacha TaxID=399045 RepID=A0A7R9BHI4_9CRUS|nr:unnamed protein product [Notodromas monacha]CAG0915334.1 unnamed protein product [Notodromas monacha]